MIVIVMMIIMRKDDDRPSCHPRTRLSQGCTIHGVPIPPVLLKVKIVETSSYTQGVPIMFIFKFDVNSSTT